MFYFLFYLLGVQINLIMTRIYNYNLKRTGNCIKPCVGEEAFALAILSWLPIASALFVLIFDTIPKAIKHR